MAKKSGRKKLNLESLDTIIDRLYASGVFHSTIVHSIIFIVLSLSFISDTKITPVKLELSFTSIDQSVSVDKMPEIEISHNDINPQDKDKESIEVAESIVQENENIEIKYTSTIEPDITENSVAEEMERLEVDELYKEIPSLKVKEKKARIAQNNRDNENDILKKIRQSLPAVTEGGLGAAGGGNIGDIGQRLRMAGAKTGDVQVSISWDTTDDIDLHVRVQTTQGLTSYISWTNRVGICRGVLDVDMNANPHFLTNKPVENIFWPHGNSPYGRFAVSVHNFRNWSGLLAVPVTVLIKVDGQMKSFKINAPAGGSPINVYEFNRASSAK